MQISEQKVDITLNVSELKLISRALGHLRKHGGTNPTDHKDVIISKSGLETLNDIENTIEKYFIQN